MADKERRKPSPMSEWMKVMLEEIDRKQSEHEEAREELERRARERATSDQPANEGRRSDDTAA